MQIHIRGFGRAPEFGEFLQRSGHGKLSLPLLKARDGGGTLDFDARRKFRVGEHVKFSEGRFEKAPKGEAKLRSAENDRLLSGSDHLLNVFRELFDNVARQPRIE